MYDPHGIPMQPMTHSSTLIPSHASRACLKSFTFKSIAILGTSLAAIGATALDAKAQNAIETYSCTSVKTAGGFNSDCVAEVTLGDKKVSNFFADLTGTELFDVTFDYTWLDPDGVADPDYSDDIWTFKLTANDPVTGNFGPFTYGYDVDITDAGWEFSQLGLDSDVAALLNRATVVKSADPGAGEEAILTLTSVNGAPAGPATFEGSYKSIVIRDTVTLVASPVVEITSVTNAWTQRPSSKVPGPLPLLGAGAAFGMSRRLRRRIKSSVAV